MCIRDSCFPDSSIPMNSFRFHLPSFKWISERLIFLAALIINAMVSSTTEIKFAVGEFVTLMFLDFANSTSILSTPTPHLAIIFRLFAFSIISFVKWVELLITAISAS